MNVEELRKVLGIYPTGVVVVTAYGADGVALGMTLGSFSSVSLDPPMIGFMPRVESKSWAEIQKASDSVGVNILSGSQEYVCRAVATRTENKFEGIAVHKSPMGNPVIDGALAYFDCDRLDTRAAGDHFIVLARVLGADLLEQGNPLLFFRGGYGSFATASLAASGEGLLSELSTADVARPFIEKLAAEFDTEVDTLHLVGDQFVITTSSGFSKTRVTPMRVGHRLPFAPPLGAVFAAWGDDSMRERWISRVPDSDAAQRQWVQKLLDAIRERGFNVTLGHDVGERLEAYISNGSGGVNDAAEASVLRLMREAAGEFAPMQLMSTERYEFRSATAPVFAPNGNVVFAITIWGPPDLVTGVELLEYTAGLQRAAANATEALANR